MVDPPPERDWPSDQQQPTLSSDESERDPPAQRDAHVFEYDPVSRDLVLHRLEASNEHVGLSAQLRVGRLQSHRPLVDSSRERGLGSESTLLVSDVGHVVEQRREHRRESN